MAVEAEVEVVPGDRVPRVGFTIDSADRVPRAVVNLHARAPVAQSIEAIRRGTDEVVLDAVSADLRDAETVEREDLPR